MQQFNLETVAFDPWQMEHLAQRLEADSGHRRRNAFLCEPTVQQQAVDA